MKKKIIGSMLKIEIAKKSKVGCVTRKMPFAEYFLVIPKRDNNVDISVDEKCILFKENKEGLNKRKFPQFQRLFTVDTEFVNNTIHLINSAYIKNPMNKGNCIKTLLNTVPLLINEEEYFITNITKVSSSSKYYDFREKATTKTITRKTVVHKKAMKHLVPEFKFGRTKINIVEQSYTEKMFREYIVYGYLDTPKLKSTALGECPFEESKKIIELKFVKDALNKDSYFCKEHNIRIASETMRILNLRIKNSGTIQCEGDYVRYRTLYAMPVLSEK